VNHEKEIATLGLNCPLAIPRAKKAFSRQAGHVLQSQAEANREFTVFMRKRSGRR